MYACFNQSIVETHYISCRFIAKILAICAMLYIISLYLLYFIPNSLYLLVLFPYLTYTFLCLSHY